jgi:UDP-N-acetyl-D-glucosamine dehydrogenase
LRDKKVVAVIGQGYVGLPLFLACAKSGWRTVGLDANTNRIEEIKTGQHDLLNENQKGELNFAIQNGTYTPITDPEDIEIASSNFGLLG